jgi:16S rRNA (adenine(1408)-N(1))-methyltransferase
LIAPYRESGIVLDIGTGDGRFVSASAKMNPAIFYIGIDANAKPLEKLSTKATRKPAKGGLPNAIFVQAAVEDLPQEFTGIASEIDVNFPWGSLLRAVATGDQNVLESFRRVLRPDGSLTVTIGVDPTRDRTELERLNIPELNDAYVDAELRSNYSLAGFDMVESRWLERSEWSKIETSWARKLSGNDERKVLCLRFVRE